MERSLYLDFMEDKGLESQERMMKSLDEFAKLEEFDQLKRQISGVLKEHQDQRDQQQAKSEQEKMEIERKVSQVMDRYNTSRSSRRGI
jgi:hypothetical protein